MAKKSDKNNIQTRLEDAKSQYDFNQKVINRLMKDIEKTPLIVKNGNNTESSSPQLRAYQELLKTNLNLRKQISDMEILMQNGTINEEKEENPFK